MPIMDGLEAIPLMRAASPLTQIVVLAGFESASMREPALSAGAHAYVQKGATPDEIIALIRERTEAIESEREAVDDAADDARETTETVDTVAERDQLQIAIATAAHELRSPSTSLMGLAQTFSRRRESLEEATVLQLLDAIVRQAKVLDRVTDDLLTSSQSSLGAVSVDVEAFPLKAALEGAALALSQQTEVRVECPDDLSVHADRVRVDQMLGNLLSNALKYARPPLALVAADCGNHAEVQVIDDGPGVPEDFEAKLFDQYSRADGIGASRTGLGLYVVKSLAEAQGGKAWYVRLSSGSSFCFSLPPPAVAS